MGSYSNHNQDIYPINYPKLTERNNRYLGILAPLKVCLKPV